MLKRFMLLVVTAAALALVATGCGSSSATSSTSSSPNSGTTGGAPLASKVPAAVRARGTLRVGSDITYPPFESYAPGSTVAKGVDVDLATAIGQQLGLKFQFVNGSFDSLIPGLQAGRYDLIMTAVFDNRKREQVVDFVDYYSAGAGFLVKRGGPAITSYAKLCGHTVAVQKGSLEAVAAQAQAAKCGAKTLKVLVVADQATANLDVQSGRADVTAADAPVVGYQAHVSNGTFQVGGYDPARTPYGIVLPKGSALAPAIQAALSALIANGKYLAILKKWGVENGAITKPSFNGAVN